jgi:hypothetical protein
MDLQAVVAEGLLVENPSMKREPGMKMKVTLC